MNSTACVELLHSSHFKMIVQGYDFPSFSGLFTVDNETNGNTFFWFFPSETDAKNAPVIMWLQGGTASPFVLRTFFSYRLTSFMSGYLNCSFSRSRSVVSLWALQ